MVDNTDAGQVGRMVRVVPASPPRPFDYLAIVAESWGEGG
jgi:hypothetical protein